MSIPNRAGKWTPPPARLLGDKLLREQKERAMQQTQQTVAVMRRVEDLHTPGLGRPIGAPPVDDLTTQVEKLQETVDTLADNLPKMVIGGGGGGRRTITKVLDRDFPDISQLFTLASISCPFIANRDAAALLDLSDYQQIVILRWSAASNFCPAFYRQVDTEPSHAAKVQDATSQWFEHDPGQIPHADALGATDSTNTPVQTTAAIQLAIDLAEARGNGKALLSARTYLIGKGGTIVSSGAGAAGFIGTTDHGIMLKSGVILEGPGRFSGCVLKSVAGNTFGMKVVVNPTLTQSSNLGIRGVLLDYDALSYPDGTFYGRCLEFWNADHVTVEDVAARNCAHGWGVVFFACQYVSMRDVSSRHPTTVVKAGNAMSIIDCSHVVGSNIECYSVGDDAFGIGALYGDCHDIIIDGLVSSAPVVSGGAGARRGIIIDSGWTAGVPGKVYNVSINAVTHDCGGAGCWVNSADSFNLDVNLSDKGSGFGLYLYSGSGANVGSVRQSRFNINSRGAVQQAVTCFLANGSSVIEDCYLNLLAYDPSTNGASAPGVVLYGSRWSGSINIDMNPLANKATPSHAVYSFAEDSHFDIIARGGGNNLVCFGNRNSWHITRMSGAVTNDILVGAVSDNQFTGGNITGAVSNSGTRTRFSGGGKFAQYGAGTVSTDSNGVATIAHGLAAAPVFYSAQTDGDDTYEATVQSVDSTNLSVRIRNTTTNADKASSSQRIIWRANI